MISQGAKRGGADRLSRQVSIEIVCEFVARRVPLLRVLSQAVQADRLEISGDHRPRWRGGMGSSSRTCFSVSTGVGAAKGGCPVSM